MSEGWHWEHLLGCRFSLYWFFLTSRIVFTMQLLTKQIRYAEDHITFPAAAPPLALPPRPICSFETYGVWGVIQSCVNRRNLKNINEQRFCSCIQALTALWKVTEGRRGGEEHFVEWTLTNK